MQNQRELTVTFLLIFAIAGIVVGLTYLSNKTPTVTPLTETILSEQAYGTPARSEREYKVSVNQAVTSDQVVGWADQMKAVLREKVAEDDFWAAPSLVGNGYYVKDDVKTFLYRDIYFDTGDGLCNKHNVSYRLRNRFKSLAKHRKHFKDVSDDGAWPYRAEFQAKFDRKEEKDGFSSVMESRFEFRKESPPFSEKNPPPGPPWPLEEFIPYFESGRFDGMITYPAQDVMRFFKDKTTNEKLEFQPVLVFITERTRQHIHMKTPWGYGPNPTQAYIISFDNVTVYDAHDYLGGLGQGKEVSTLQSIGAVVELEVEFERNVSQNLDLKIKSLGESGDSEEADRLEKIREAFVSDQKKIIRTLADYLKDKHKLELKPQNRSKFGQAGLLKDARSR